MTSGPGAGSERESHVPEGPPLSGGLADALDEDRARSLADEGGAAGAVVEAQVVEAELVSSRAGLASQRGDGRLANAWRLAGLVVALVAAYALWRSR